MKMTHILRLPLRFLTSVFVWGWIAVDTCLAFLLIAAFSPFDRQQKISYRFANLWGVSAFRFNPLWNIKVIGKRRLKKDESYVLVANHSSLADIVCLYGLGHHFKWMAKSSLFKIPFFGWTMALLRYIPLKRGRHGSIRESFRTSESWLEKNVSILIFPEGTRSVTGKLGAFKNGAFKLALHARKPIVPIVIKGTGAVLSKGKLTVPTKARAVIHVLKPIPTEGYGPDEYETLKQRVWNAINGRLTMNSSRQIPQPKAV